MFTAASTQVYGGSEAVRATDTPCTRPPSFVLCPPTGTRRNQDWKTCNL